MSGVEHFNDTSAINPFMDAAIPVNRVLAAREHAAISQALGTAGVDVISVDPPKGCQDGVYTANWGLERDDTVVLARLPNARRGEEAYAERVFKELGKRVVHVPNDWRFSGQGDALPCGNYLFCGQKYRSDEEAQAFAANTLGFKRIQLETIPQLDVSKRPVVNRYSGWPDSFFYDIDLALAVIKPPIESNKGLIAWCPEAFTPKSRTWLEEFDGVEKIAVCLAETVGAYALNLVSTGETVIMNNGAPELQRQLTMRGLSTLLLSNLELAKGGGSIRCTSVCVSNA